MVVATKPDKIDRAIQATAQNQPAGLEMTVQLPTGREALIRVPTPLTPVDVVQLYLAIGDIVTGRITSAEESPDIRQRVAAKGIALPS